MLRRVTSKSEAELSPAGQAEYDGVSEGESKIGSSELNARVAMIKIKKNVFMNTL